VRAFSVILPVLLFCFVLLLFIISMFEQISMMTMEFVPVKRLTLTKPNEHFSLVGHDY